MDGSSVAWLLLLRVLLIEAQSTDGVCAKKDTHTRRQGDGEGNTLLAAPLRAWLLGVSASSQRNAARLTWTAELEMQLGLLRWRENRCAQAAHDVVI